MGAKHSNRTHQSRLSLTLRRGALYSFAQGSLAGLRMTAQLTARRRAMQRTCWAAPAKLEGASQRAGHARRHGTQVCKLLAARLPSALQSLWMHSSGLLVQMQQPPCPASANRHRFTESSGHPRLSLCAFYGAVIHNIALHRAPFACTTAAAEPRAARRGMQRTARKHAALLAALIAVSAAVSGCKASFNSFNGVDAGLSGWRRLAGVARGFAGHPRAAAPE